jgi:hypothetical protein
VHHRRGALGGPTYPAHKTLTLTSIAYFRLKVLESSSPSKSLQFLHRYYPDKTFAIGFV